MTKQGRNEPCWCGSGKKYKRCHWPQPRVPSWQAYGPSLDYLALLQTAHDPEYDPSLDRAEFLQSNEETARVLSEIHISGWDIGTQETWKQELILEGERTVAFPSSPKENPSDQYLLNQLMPPLMGVFRQYGIKEPPKLAVGVLRTETINAVAMRVPGTKDAFVIGLNAGTINFLSSAAILFAKFMPDAWNVTSLQALVKHVETYASQSVEWIPKELTAILIAYLKGHSPPATELKRERLGIMTALYRSMISFVIAHELAHVALRHLESAADLPPRN